ncbi:MAG: zinc ribbon domain-containing protein [Candidatus Methanoplasma sp.]|nr:zinc ribbon domain-containing protein [Candidatus Methanoplasma sp.]
MCHGQYEWDYCVYCARADGSMQSFEEKLKDLTSFIVRARCLDGSAAEKTAEDMMRELPARKGHHTE